MTLSRRVLATLSLLAFPAAGWSQQDWSQWRGPSRDGKIERAGPWPSSLGEASLKKVWEVELAEGYASPIVAGGQVFTVESRKKKDEITRAFDLATGEESWSLEWAGAMKVPFFAARNGSWVRSTPAAANGAVYVGGMRDVLVRIDAASGEEQWRIDFREREGTELPAFGHVASPLVDGSALYVQAGCAVAKLDAATGKTLWRALEDRRAMFGSAFSSPVIATIHGVRQVVAQTRSTLGGLDPGSGEVLWSIPVEAFRGMNILTPTVIGNRVFTATYGGGSFMFEIVRDETGEFSVETLWRDKELEGYMSSPIAIGDHLYLHTRSKHFACIEAETGKVAWKTDEKFGDYWSMVANGERILALDQKGELLLIDASPASFQLLDRRKVSKDSTWAHVGIAGDRVLIRALKGLAVWEWQ